WANLDRSVAACRAALGPPDRLVEILRLDEEIAAELLLGVGIGAIYDAGPAVPNPDRRCGGSRLHAFAGGGAFRLGQGSVEGAPVGVDCLHLLRLAAEVVLVVVNE